jgi:hypothetical protein
MSYLQWTVLPLVLHVGLTFIVGALSLRSRFKTVLKGETKLESIANNSSAWPENVRKLGNNFDNQFQVPTLAYGSIALIAATGLADAVTATLAWLFIAARTLHSMEHVGLNRVPLRMRLFLLSYAAVIALWIWFAVRFFIAG